MTSSKLKKSLSTDTNKMESQDIGGEIKRDFVRKFSDKWVQEEPYNNLALGVAVAANGPEDPLKLQETFKNLYQDPDGTGLVSVRLRCHNNCR